MVHAKNNTINTVATTLEHYLQPSIILDYQADYIQKLINDRDWKSLEPTDLIGAIYNFVRDEIKFGYNMRDDILEYPVFTLWCR